MDVIIIIVMVILAAPLFAWLVARFGIWLKIPFLKRWFDRMETRKRNAEKRYSIHFDEEQITLSNLQNSNTGQIHIGWAAIERLTVFKRDLFAVDLVCLWVEVSDGKGIELDEKMDGWDPFIDAMPTHLIGCKKLHEWFSEVAFPAFASNPTEIFRRGAVAKQSCQ